MARTQMYLNACKVCGKKAMSRTPSAACAAHAEEAAARVEAVRGSRDIPGFYHLVSAEIEIMAAE